MCDASIFNQIKEAILSLGQRLNHCPWNTSDGKSAAEFTIKAALDAIDEIGKTPKQECDCCYCKSKKEGNYKVSKLICPNCFYFECSCKKEKLYRIKPLRWNRYSPMSSCITAIGDRYLYSCDWWYRRLVIRLKSTNEIIEKIKCKDKDDGKKIAEEHYLKDVLSFLEEVENA